VDDLDRPQGQGSGLEQVVEVGELRQGNIVGV
jgi:hypothetical protein